jgi:phosphate transport system substrate-binding protein
MRASFWKMAIVVALASPPLAGTATAAATLRLAGTGTSTEMLRQVGAKFTAATGIKIDVIPGLGSTGAIAALADGLLDLAVPGRPLTAKESVTGLTQVAVMRTAFVIATSHRNPNGLKSTDLAGIFTARAPTWSDGTPIRIILRPRSDVDTTLLGQMFAGMDNALEVARDRDDVPTAATDQDNVALAERIAGSLTGTTMTQIKTEHANLRIVPLDGAEPTLANFEGGAYPFAKKLYVVVPPRRSVETQQFVDFLRSPQGVKALRDTETLLDAE